MANYRVTLSCRNYDRTQPLIRGLVKADGIDLEVLERESVPAMFAGLYRGEVDASEMSLAELVYYTSRGQNDFVGIPVFPSRVFRHSFIFCHPRSGIRRPQDLSGKKIGFPRLVQTACIWIRGMLVEMYGVSARETGWYVASIHHWEDGAAGHETRPHDGSTLHVLERGGKDENEYIETALAEGKIDALGSAQRPSSLKGDTNVKRLFEDVHEVEADYYKRTRIFPIMHVLAVQRGVVEKHPDLPEKLFKLFSEAKKQGREWLQMDPSLSLVWKNHWMERETEIFREDPWAYGLDKNRHVIEKFISYCYDLGVAEKKLDPGDLFVPSTWDLTEA